MAESFLIMQGQTMQYTRNITLAEDAARDMLKHDTSIPVYIFKAIKEVTAEIEITTKYRSLEDTYQIAGHSFPLSHAEKKSVIDFSDLEHETDYWIKLNDESLTAQRWYSANHGRIYKVWWNGREFCIKDFIWKKILPEDCTLVDGPESEADDAE